MKAPENISEQHQVNSFDCGNAALNDWLKRKALKNEKSHDSRTYVICEGQIAIGYYCIATGSVDHTEAPAVLKRNAPDPISVMILGRLAIDKTKQKLGLGKALLKDAILKTLTVSKEVGVKALVVHAISEEAKQFYLSHGFISSPIEMTLMLPLKDIIKNIN